jgi:lysophospholipase L1-like esterase
MANPEVRQDDSFEREVRLEDSLERVGPALLRWSLFAVLAYLILVFGFNHTVLGIPMHPATTAVALLVVVVVTYVIVRAARTSSLLSPKRMGEIGLLLAGTMGAILMADVISGVVMNVRGQGFSFQWDTQKRRMRQDTTAWQTDIVPPFVILKGEHFKFYKPGGLAEGNAYGYLYGPELLASRTLRDSVLEQRHFRYQIGPSGFRDPKPVSACRIFGIGDSFTFGYGVQGDETWPARLEARLHEPVCNIGVSGAAPAGEAALMRYLVTTHRATCVKELAWMLFEGNDLDDDEEPGEDTGESQGLGERVAGTLLQPVAQLPWLVQNESLIRKLLNHELFVMQKMDKTGIRSIDGVTLINPLFRSDALGPKLFFQNNIYRTQDRLSHIQNHPNRPRVEGAFRDMKALATKNGFHVTVVIAPLDTRVYAKEFHDFPPIEPPYLNDWWTALADSSGFKVVNLYTPFAAQAKSELFYLRDDVHFNARGNDEAARILADSLRTWGISGTAAAAQGSCGKPQA